MRQGFSEEVTLAKSVKAKQELIRQRGEKRAFQAEGNSSCKGVGVGGTCPEQETQEVSERDAEEGEMDGGQTKHAKVRTFIFILRVMGSH